MKRIFTLIIGSVVCIAYPAEKIYCQVNVQDSTALVDLYNSTNGFGWLNNANWLEVPVALWYGVTSEIGYQLYTV